MDIFHSTYQIGFFDDNNTIYKTEVFNFQQDSDSYELIASTAEETQALPEWTTLSYKQCSHCPLTTEDNSHCPLAVQMFQLSERFHQHTSIDSVELQFITAERQLIQKTDLQHAISAMFNLIFPSCGCPQTQMLKPLARFNLPTVSEEETIFRITSTFLLGSYFQNSHSSETADFTILHDFYEQMNILNKAMAARLTLATQSDACKNAITLQDMYATLVPALLEEQLLEMRSGFEGFLRQDSKKEPSTSQYLAAAKAHQLELTNHNEDNRPKWMKDLDEKDSDTVSDNSKKAEEPSFGGLSLAPLEGEVASKAIFTIADD